MAKNTKNCIFKKSRFVKELSDDNTIAFYHTLSQELIFGNPVLRELMLKFRSGIDVDTLLKTYDKADRTLIQKIINELCNKNFLIEKSVDEGQFVRKLQSKLPQKPDFTHMYLILTETCNFDCNYCFIEKENKKNNIMSIKTAEKGIDFFIKYGSNFNKKHRIILYGGEPLLNFPVIEFSIKYLKEKYAQNPLAELNIDLITNGSLITKNIANFLSENDVSVTVSIDGFQEIHDAVRVYPSGKGTFDETVRGYNLLKDAGCDVSVSCTVGEHNIEKLESITEYLVKELHTKAVNFNLIGESSNKKNDGSMLKIINKLIKSFEIARDYGVRIEPIMKKARAFVEKQFRFYNCSACGKQIVIAPNGDVGPCHAFLNSRKFFNGNIYDPNYNPIIDPIFKEWNRYSPININTCINCPAIAICGGGCPHNNYIYRGDLWKIDSDDCLQNKVVLKWLIRQMKITNL